MDAAIERLRSVADPPSEPEALFAPLAETVYWITALEDQVYGGPNQRHTHPAEALDGLLGGLRYVRNHLTHHGIVWKASDVRAVYAERYYRSYGVWVWYDVSRLESLPRKDADKVQRPKYEQNVANRVVLDTIYNAADRLRECTFLDG